MSIYNHSLGLSSIQEGLSRYSTAWPACCGTTTGGTASNFVIGDGSIVTDMLADGAVTTAKLADLSVTTDKLAFFAVTSNKIASGAITQLQMANESVPSRCMVNNAVYPWHLSANSVTEAKIEDGAVTRTKVRDNTITTSHIFDGAITTDKIADGAITQAKLAAGVGGGTAVIADNSITSAQLKGDESRFKVGRTFGTALEYQGGTYDVHGQWFQAQVLPGNTGITQSYIAGFFMAPNTNVSSPTFRGCQGIAHIYCSSKTAPNYVYKSGYLRVYFYRHQDHSEMRFSVLDRIPINMISLDVVASSPSDGLVVQYDDDCWICWKIEGAY